MKLKNETSKVYLKPCNYVPTHFYLKIMGRVAPYDTKELRKKLATANLIVLDGGDVHYIFENGEVLLVHERDNHFLFSHVLGVPFGE